MPSHVGSQPGHVSQICLSCALRKQESYGREAIRLHQGDVDCCQFLQVATASFQKNGGQKKPVGSVDSSRTFRTDEHDVDLRSSRECMLDNNIPCNTVR